LTFDACLQYVPVSFEELDFRMFIALKGISRIFESIINEIIQIRCGARRQCLIIRSTYYERECTEISSSIFVRVNVALTSIASIDAAAAPDEIVR